jgi:hypothetical protein
VAIWLGGLILVGAVAAWRSVIWTLEVLARRTSRDGVVAGSPEAAAGGPPVVEGGGAAAR